MGYSDFVDYSRRMAEGHVKLHRRQDGACGGYRPLGAGSFGENCLTCAYYNTKNCGASSVPFSQYGAFT